MIGRLLDLLLGPKCVFGCGRRVYPDDLRIHVAVEHAGDVRGV